MIDCLRNMQVTDRMAVLIAKIYILQLIYPSDKKKCYSLLSSPSAHLQELLLKYGRPVEFMVIATAFHLNTYSNRYFLSKFTLRLLATFRQEEQHKRNKAYYSSFFGCLKELLRISPVNDAEDELKMLVEILELVRNGIGRLDEEEIIGYFKVGVTLLDRHFKAGKG
jgi:hypothetical protein